MEALRSFILEDRTSDPPISSNCAAHRSFNGHLPSDIAVRGSVTYPVDTNVLHGRDLGEKDRLFSRPPDLHPVPAYLGVLRCDGIRRQVLLQLAAREVPTFRAGDDTPRHSTLPYRTELPVLARDSRVDLNPSHSISSGACSTLPSAQ